MLDSKGLYGIVYKKVFDARNSMNSVIVLISLTLAFNIMRASVYPAKRNSSHSMAWICSGFFIQCMLLGVFYSALSYIFLYTAISSLWLMSICAFIAWQQCELFYLIYQSHTFNKKTARKKKN